MLEFCLIWTPDQTHFATVMAPTAGAARRKAPYPWRRYIGEIEAVTREELTKRLKNLKQ